MHTRIQNGAMARNRYCVKIILLVLMYMHLRIRLFLFSLANQHCAESSVIHLFKYS